MVRSTLKKVTAVAFAAIMTASMFVMSSVPTEAASKNPTKIYLNKTSISLATGKSYTLRVTKTRPNRVTYKTVKWTTSDKKIATVSKYGTVKAIKPGKVTITATSTKNTKVKASCTVSVYKNGWKRVEPSVSGGLYTYKMPDSSATYAFKANDQVYKITDYDIKNFMTLFGTSKNNLINRWNAKRNTYLRLGQLSVSVTGIKTDRTLKITGPAAYEGTYKARLYNSRSSYAKGHDYVFAVKGEKTGNQWQFIYVDSSKTRFTFTATNKQGVKYTAVVNKNGKAAYLKAGKKILYKYAQTAKYDELSMDYSIVKSANVKGYYWGRVTK